jgi:glycine cleavage system H protein
MASLNHPADLKYSQTDEWVRVQGDNATIGITDYAQDQLGDIVYIDFLSHPGDKITHKTKFGDIESVKATSELLSPISGEVVKVNEDLKDQPELINDNPYEQGWMLVVKITNSSELDNLMTADQYKKYLEGR